MNRKLLVGIILLALGLSACETMKEGTTAAGTVVGKTADVVGGVSEGAADAYKGKDVTANNPYNR